MTEDAILRPPSASYISFLYLCTFTHLPPICHLLFLHSTLPSRLLSPSLSLCHFFSSPSHLLPSLRRVWHAHGPNSIIDQIKEMLLNSLNRQKEHSRAPETPKGYNHTHTNTCTHKGKQTMTLYSLGRVQKKKKSAQTTEEKMDKL